MAHFHQFWIWRFNKYCTQNRFSQECPKTLVNDLLTKICIKMSEFKIHHAVGELIDAMG